jgi:hypothetical protein
MATATGSLAALALPAAMPAPVLPSPSALPTPATLLTQCGLAAATVVPNAALSTADVPPVVLDQFGVGPGCCWPGRVVRGQQ